MVSWQSAQIQWIPVAGTVVEGMAAVDTVVEDMAVVDMASVHTVEEQTF